MSQDHERPVDERLAAFVDGCMSERERDRFVAELRVNPQLQKDLDEYERTVDAVRRALRADTVAVDVTDRVMAAIASGAGAAPPLPAPMRNFRLVATVAAAAALLTLAVWLNSLPSQRTPAIDIAAHADDGVTSESAAAEFGDGEADHDAGGAPMTEAENPFKPNQSGSSGESAGDALAEAKANARAFEKRTATGAVDPEANARIRSVLEQSEARQVVPPSAGRPPSDQSRDQPREQQQQIEMQTAAGDPATPPGLREKLEASRLEGLGNEAANREVMRRALGQPPKPAGNPGAEGAEPQQKPAAAPQTRTGSDDFYLGATRRSADAKERDVTHVGPATDEVAQPSKTPSKSGLPDNTTEAPKPGAKAPTSLGYGDPGAPVQTGSAPEPGRRGGRLSAQRDGGKPGRNEPEEADVADERKRKGAAAEFGLTTTLESPPVAFLQVTRYFEPAIPPPSPEAAGAGETREPTDRQQRSRNADRAPGKPTPSGPTTPGPGPAGDGPGAPKAGLVGGGGAQAGLATLDEVPVDIAARFVFDGFLGRDLTWKQTIELQGDQSDKPARPAGLRLINVTDEVAANRANATRRANSTVSAPVDERCWLVEGPPAEVKQLMQRVVQWAKREGYEIGNGEIPVAPRLFGKKLALRSGESRDEGSPEERGSGGSSPAGTTTAVEPSPSAAAQQRIVLRFRSLRRPK